MKEEKMLRAFSLADDEYVKEADPTKSNTNQASNKRGAPFRRIGIIAVAACLLVALILPIALVGNHNGSVTTPDTTPNPAPDPGRLDEYRDSEYYSIIAALDAYYQKNGISGSYPETPEDDGGLIYEPTGSASAVDTAEEPEDTVPDKIPGESDGETGDIAPDDITDNQVAGVVEADRIKRTETHIFYLRSTVSLDSYEIKGADTVMTGSFSLPEIIAKGNIEFYLSADGQRALLTSSYYEGNTAQTVVTLVDVRDPSQMKEIKTVQFLGTLSTTRLAQESLLLFTSVYLHDVLDYDDPTTFVPCVNEGDGFEPLSASDVVIPAEINSRHYTCVYLIDPDTLEVQARKALLSTAAATYVSLENIYLATTNRVNENLDGYRTYKSCTDIICLSYTDGTLLKKGSVTVDGYLKDQYSMDEHNGVLRVVTTVDYSRYKTYTGVVDDNSYVNGTTADPFDTTEAVPEITVLVDTTAFPEDTLAVYPDFEEDPTEGTLIANEGEEVPPEGEEVPVTPSPIPENFTGLYVSASLYCVSLTDFQVIASVEAFAPRGETVQSVRFDGNAAYVCTSIVLTDPVFFFDLTDLDKITVKDTGVIEGYSSSLVNFGDKLLGIGYGDGWDTLKIEVYEEGENDVVSLDAVIYELCGFSPNYKDYYVDRINHLVGMGVLFYENALYGDKIQQCYVLLHFDGEKLVELVNTPLNGSQHTCRAVYIDGYLYLFSDYDFKVMAVSLPQ